MNDLRFLPALRLAMSATALGLIASTWPLWTGTSSFPQIPFLESLCEVGVWADGVCLALILAGSVSTLIGATVSLIDNGRNREQRVLRIALRLETIGPCVFAMGLGLSVLLNQHRLQPWVWHFMLLVPLLARPPRRSDGIKRPIQNVLILTTSIYFFSAVSKLDSTFATTYGQQFVDALLGTMDASSRFWPGWLKSTAAFLLPLGELAAAVLLAIPRVRRTGLAVAILMHGMLILAVGPLGMNHQPGVLIWNSFFITQNAILWSYFSSASYKHVLESKDAANSAERQRLSKKGLTSIDADTAYASKNESPFQRKRRIWTNLSFAECLPALSLIVGILLPFLRFSGFSDPWPAWVVYASRPARVTVFVDTETAKTLPSEHSQFVQLRQLDDGRAFFRIDRWSIEATGAPIYPGDRFPFAVARALSERPEIAGQVDIVVESAAGWWTEERTSYEYRGQDEITVAAGTFRLNTRARVRR